MARHDLHDGDNGALDGDWSQSRYAGVARAFGKFSKAESEKVRKSVKEYCAARQISVARLCSECDHKAELKGAWMEIAKAIPERNVQSVYRHGLRLLHPFKRGEWTEAEGEMLDSLVSRYGKKWATIQDKLNRSADACRDKYRERSSIYNKGRWKDKETEIFKRVVLEHLNVDPTADIKEVGRMVEAKGIKIPWSIISKRFGKRSRLSCLKRWEKLTGPLYPSDPCENAGGAGSKFTDMDVAVPDPDVRSAEEPPAKKPPARIVKNPPRSHSTYAARTAGEAALAASSPVNNPIDGGDTDMYLLSELSNLDVARMSDVVWEGIKVENAQERWMELFEELQVSLADDSVLTMPLSSVAQMILDRKTSAQQAAETVEAVDLPEV